MADTMIVVYESVGVRAYFGTCYRSNADRAFLHVAINIWAQVSAFVGINFALVGGGWERIVITLPIGNLIAASPRHRGWFWCWCWYRASRKTVSVPAMALFILVAIGSWLASHAHARTSTVEYEHVRVGA
jgi:hypothetical protein